MRRFLAIVLILASACRRDDLTAIVARLRHEPADIDFGDLAVGQRAERVIAIENDTRSAIEAQFTALVQPFNAAPPARLQPGTNTFTVSFEPSAPGGHESALALFVGGAGVISIGLQGSAHSVTCSSNDVCHVSTFSPDSGTCIITDAPAGTRCGGSGSCVESGQCVGRECRGTPANCDDGDHCTTDSCSPGLGCVHAPLVCPGLGACQIGSCDSATGCTLTPAAEDTSCGTGRSCLAADVCIAGLCERRDPPDGFVCAPASPCQAAGRCLDDVCVQAPPISLTAGWSFDGRLPDGGPGGAWSDVLLTAKDDVVLSSYFVSAPVLKANRPVPVTLRANARRCIVWRAWLVCADLPGAGVSASDLETGAEVWAYTSVRDDVWQLSQPGIDTFLARMLVLGPQRLGVLFESRTVTASGADTLCRRYSYVVLDEQGHKQAAAFLEDPVFSVCAHPHSFGAAADTAGNAYFGFDFSGTTNPASHGTCAILDCVLLSLSPAGAVRWKTHRYVGGELAVANGALYSGAVNSVVSTANGERLPTRGSPAFWSFGRGVVWGNAEAWPNQFDTLVLRDRAASISLSYPSTPNIEAHAAWWSGADGSANRVALVIRNASAGTPVLTGVSLDDPTKQFECELADTSGVSLFELGKTGMVVMSQTVALGLNDCASCDPRFAQTRNRFQWFDLPTLRAAPANWAGPYGGAAHSHQEQRP